MSEEKKATAAITDATIAACAAAQEKLPDGHIAILISYVPKVNRLNDKANVDVAYGDSPDLQESLAMLACVGERAEKVLRGSEETPLSSLDGPPCPKE